MTEESLTPIGDNGARNSELPEVTITHNLGDATEVEELYRRRWIALDFGRKGSDPQKYTGSAKTAVKLFNTMQQKGAAVIAAFRKTKANSRSRHFVGLVEAGAEFEDFNGLLCLPLSKVQEVDVARNFLGNLPPRQCTIQQCGNRAKGRLAELVRGQISPRTVELLHHLDVEWLVTNYLVVTGICECVWSGGRSHADIDHAGWTPDGRELLAQTTISADFVRKKADRLWTYNSADRVLYLFGPAASESQCLDRITYVPIESLIPRLDQEKGGQWLVNRMLARLVPTTEPNEKDAGSKSLSSFVPNKSAPTLTSHGTLVEQPSPDACSLEFS